MLIGENSTGNVMVNNHFGLTPSGENEAPIDHGIVNFVDEVGIADNLLDNATECAVRINGTARKTVFSRNRLGLPVFCIGTCSTNQGNTRSILVEGCASRLWLKGVANGLVNAVPVTGDDNEPCRVQVYGGASDGTALIDIGTIGLDNQGINAVPNPTPGNRSINWPMLQATPLAGIGNVGVSGQLASANGTYGIDFHPSPRRLNESAPTPRCEGRVLPGDLTNPVVMVNASPGVNGTVSFSALIELDAIADRCITAVARREVVIDGVVREGDTSECVSCIELPLPGDGFEAVNKACERP